MAKTSAIVARLQKEKCRRLYADYWGLDPLPLYDPTDLREQDGGGEPKSYSTPFKPYDELLSPSAIAQAQANLPGYSHADVEFAASVLREPDAIYDATEHDLQCNDAVMKDIRAIIANTPLPPTTTSDVPAAPRIITPMTPPTKYYNTLLSQQRKQPSPPEAVFLLLQQCNPATRIPFAKWIQLTRAATLVYNAHQYNAHHHPQHNQQPHVCTTNQQLLYSPPPLSL
jgi:hypothetical protein